jgi:hypothetical protein
MDNSAAHLLNILLECRKQDEKISCIQAWRKVLSANNNVDTLEAIGEFLVLMQRTASDVLAIHNDIEAVNYWRVRILNGFNSTALSQPWKGFVQHIDEPTVFTVRAQAALLASARPRAGLDDKKIAGAQSAFSESIDLLESSDVPDELKRILLTRIEQIQSLLNRYRFISPDAALDAAKILAAEISAAHKDQREELAKSGFYAKVKEGLEIVANATQIASSSPRLVAGTSYLLGLLS